MISFRRQIDPVNRLAAWSLKEHLDQQLSGKAGRDLVQAIEQANRPMIDQPTASERARTDGRARVPMGFPWITPVLGTGIVDIGLKDGGRTLAARIMGFAATLDDLAPIGNEGSRTEIGQDFIRALADERLGGGWAPESPPEPAECAGAAHLAVAVALLTRLHHLAIGLAGSPIPRWDDQLKPRIPRPLPEAPELTVALLTAVGQELAWLEENGATELENPIRALVINMRKTLDGQRLPSHGELRLLTECAWYEASKGALTYPGWSDLLLGLTMEYPPPIAHQDGWARPPYKVVSDVQNSGIIGRYREAAKDSWKSRHDEPKRARSLHDLFAEVLKAQAELWDRNEGPWTTPFASAFVTGFDVELELALLAARQPFVLAMPAFVEPKAGGAETSILWFYRRVDPPAPSGGLPMFERASWRAHSGSTDPIQITTDRGTLPMVVRLTGCPGVVLPSPADGDALRQDLCNLLGDRDWASMTIRPAYVLDEFVAGALGATESFLDHLDHAHLGLPKRITGVPGGVNAMFARYWLAVGVQVGDSSIRQRLLSQLTAPQLSSAQPTNRPTSSGLVVNRRIGQMDARTMHWLGFDVVADEGATLVPHLEHYLAHLESPEERCSNDGGCQLKVVARA